MRHAWRWEVAVAYKLGMDYKLTELLMSRITADDGIQPRAEFDESRANDYAESLDVLPPVAVFNDGSKYWLSDGRHRFRAHVIRGRKTIVARVYAGTRLDALTFSIEENKLHNAKEWTRADRNRSIELLLQESPRWSNRQIALMVGCCDKTVGNVIRAISEQEQERSQIRKYNFRGNTFTMDVSTQARERESIASRAQENRDAEVASIRKTIARAVEGLMEVDSENELLDVVLREIPAFVAGRRPMPA